MNIKIICLGKIKEKFLQDAIDEYKKRISKYANFEIVELPDEPIPDNPSEKEILSIKKLEAQKISKCIKNTDYVISLDLRGTMISSEALAQKITDITVNGYSTICFIIGGTVGLDNDIVTNSDFVISFSKLTFPHQLIRLFLSEQIFRCFKINNHEKYHW